MDKSKYACIMTPKMIPRTLAVQNGMGHSFFSQTQVVKFANLEEMKKHVASTGDADMHKQYIRYEELKVSVKVDVQ